MIWVNHIILFPLWTITCGVVGASPFHWWSLMLIKGSTVAFMRACNVGQLLLCCEKICTILMYYFYIFASEIYSPAAMASRWAKKSEQGEHLGLFFVRTCLLYKISVPFFNYLTRYIMCFGIMWLVVCWLVWLNY